MITKQRHIETVFQMQGEPGGYKTRITTGGRVGDDDTAQDGVARPGAVMVVEGLEALGNAPKEVTVFRSYGEDELRELARLCLIAASELRRIETKRRKALS